MQAKDRKVDPVQSTEPVTGSSVTPPAEAAISISAQRWRTFENAFPFGPPIVVVAMLLWVGFQFAAYGKREDWPAWLQDLPQVAVPHAVAFSVATALLLLVFLARSKSLKPLGLRSEGVGADLRFFAVAAIAMGAFYLSLAGLGYLGLLIFTDNAKGIFEAELHRSFFKDTSALEILRVVVWYPILEEIWYRGLLYTPVRRERGRVVAIILTALIFAFAHGNALPINQFLGGLIFAIAYELRRGLLAPILLHMAGNGALALLGWAYMNWMV